MNQTMVEGADEQEVVQVRSASSAPEPDVVSLGEGPGPTPREAASTVPVADLARHPSRGLTRHPPQTHHVARPILHDGLYAGVAEQALRGLGIDHRSVFEFAGIEGALAVHPGMDHYRGTALIRVTGDPGGTEGNQGIGAPRRCEARILLVGHHRDRPGHALQRLHHGCTLSGWEVSLETETTALLGVPPRHGTGLFGRKEILGRSAHRVFAPMTDGSAGDLGRPAEEFGFVVSGGEPREFHHLVQADLAPGEGVG
jgi:hypothetical protein